jgi:hypothetical protein
MWGAHCDPSFPSFIPILTRLRGLLHLSSSFFACPKAFIGVNRILHAYLMLRCIPVTQRRLGCNQGLPHQRVRLASCSRNVNRRRFIYLDHLSRYDLRRSPALGPARSIVWATPPRNNFFFSYHFHLGSLFYFPAPLSAPRT